MSGTADVLRTPIPYWAQILVGGLFLADCIGLIVQIG